MSLADISDMKYEYFIQFYTAGQMPVLSWEGFLNHMGDQGWELIQVVSKMMIDEPAQFANHTFVFKREKKLMI